MKGQHQTLKVWAVGQQSLNTLAEEKGRRVGRGGGGRIAVAFGQSASHAAQPTRWLTPTLEVMCWHLASDNTRRFAANSPKCRSPAHVFQKKNWVVTKKSFAFVKGRPFRAPKWIF